MSALGCSSLVLARLTSTVKVSPHPLPWVGEASAYVQSLLLRDAGLKADAAVARRSTNSPTIGDPHR